MLGTKLLQPGEWRNADASVWTTSALVGAAVFAAFRSLPEVSHARLLECEDVLLNSIAGDVRHHWTKFTTANSTWHIHSLRLTRHHETEVGNSTNPGAVPASRTPPGWHRPTVVLLHGHSAGAAHWEAVVDSIGEFADFHVLDLPGWGRSPMPECLQECARKGRSQNRIIELHCEMLAGWLEANKIGKIVLMGHSFGGFHTVQFARRFPERISQVILVAPAGCSTLMPEGGYAWGLYFKYMPPQRVARNFGRVGYKIFRELYLAYTTEDSRFPDFYYQLAAATACTGKADYLAAQFVQFDAKGGLWWTHPMLTELMQIDVPLSIMWGQCDDLLQPVFGPLIYRIRPRTDLYLIKDALHNPAHNNAKAFCDAVADCLLKYRGAPRVTMLGKSPGIRFSDGTADALLEPSASPTHGFDPVPAAQTQRVDRSDVGRHSHEESRFSLSEPPSLLRTAIRQHFARDSGMQTVIGDISVDARATLPSVDDRRASKSAESTPTLPRNDSTGSLDSLDGSDGSGSVSEFGSSTTICSDRSSPEEGLGESTPMARQGLAEDKLLYSPSSAANLRLLAPPTPRTLQQFSSGEAEATAGEADRRNAAACSHVHDGVVGDVGRGRGFCNACYRAVHNYKSYWRCACAAWSFNGFLDTHRTRRHFVALLAFLDELYVQGTFNARTSTSIIMYLKVRSPLPPKAVPSPKEPFEDDASAQVAAASGVRTLDTTGLTHRGAPPTESSSAAAALHIDAAPAESLTQWLRLLHDPREARAVRLKRVHTDERVGAGSNGIVFPPGGHPFERGVAFLL